MYISRCAHVLLQLLKRKSSHPTTNLTSSHASSILAVHQQKGFNFPMLTRSGGAGPNFEVGLGRGGGRKSPPSGQPGQSTGRWQPVSRVLALTLPPGSQVEHFAQTQGPQTPARKGPFLQGEFLGGLQLPSPAPMVEIKGSSTEVEKPLGFS